MHGSLAKEEKYWFIRILCAGIDKEDFRGRILLATSAANVGIDNQLVTLVLCIGWCRDLCTYFQQRGRGGRDPTMQATFLQLGSSQSFVSLHKDSVVRFLESHHFSKEMPLIAHGDNVVDV